MKLEIFEHSKNYTATIINLPVKEKIEGLDNLVRVSLFGYDCLIDKNADENDLYIFFPSESKLSSEFLSKNSLYRDSTLNRDNTKKGFFENSGRVKAIKLRGFISTGYITSIKSLEGIVDYKELRKGDEFNSINGIEICRKNKPKRNNTEGERKSKADKKLERFDKLIPNQFRFHIDTYHLGKFIHLFDEDNMIISITDKWHGTSAVFSNVLVNKTLKWYENLLIKLGINIVKTEYDNLYSSRKVLKNRYINPEQNSYYNTDIWGIVNEEIKNYIEEGITLYGEIVGYLPDGGYIQKPFDYKCEENKHKFLVYRITYTKPNGDIIEFTWDQIKEYCKKYNIPHVKEFFYGSLRELKNTLNVTTDSTDELLLKILSSFNVEKDCKENYNKVPAEGIVLRIDGKRQYNAFKVKSKRFLEMESKLMDQDYSDIEEEN
jgi:hypothetical protein